MTQKLLYFPIFVLLFSCFSSFILVPAFAESGADVNTDGGDININISIDTGDALNSIKKVATKGIRTAKRGARIVNRLVDQVTRPIRRLLERLKRRLLRLKRRLTRERRRFNGFKQRILAIANAGGDVPQPLAQQAGVSAAEIYRLQHEVILLRVEIEQIKARERRRDAERN